MTQTDLESWLKSSDTLRRLAAILRVAESEVVKQVEHLIAEKRDQEQKIDSLKTILAQSAVCDLKSKTDTISDILKQ